ncbi:hypothetical protein JCM33374_g6469 [Metschnikowia sp. JCM 33374]|nr:hypothetical protein JCM33374_g6469 [Metschnikowia sp. JCM 33374]
MAVVRFGGAAGDYGPHGTANSHAEGGKTSPTRKPKAVSKCNSKDAVKGRKTGPDAGNGTCTYCCTAPRPVNGMCGARSAPHATRWGDQKAGAKGNPSISESGVNNSISWRMQQIVQHKPRCEDKCDENAKNSTNSTVKDMGDSFPQDKSDNESEGKSMRTWLQAMFRA